MNQSLEMALECWVRSHCICLRRVIGEIFRGAALKCDENEKNIDGVNRCLIEKNYQGKN